MGKGFFVREKTVADPLEPGSETDPSKVTFHAGYEGKMLICWVDFKPDGSLKTNLSLGKLEVDSVSKLEAIAYELNTIINSVKQTVLGYKL